MPERYGTRMTKYVHLVIETRPAGAGENAWAVDPRILQLGPHTWSFSDYWPSYPGDTWSNALEAAGWDWDRWAFQADLPPSALARQPAPM